MYFILCETFKFRLANLPRYLETKTAMERGRTFYVALVGGIIALVLLLVSVNLPAQLVIESKPYTLVVLKSGKLDGWTAKELGLSSAEFELVKNNYAQFLSRHQTSDYSDSSDSSEEDDNDGTFVHVISGKDGANVTYSTDETVHKENAVAEGTLNKNHDNNDNIKRKRADDAEEKEDDDEKDGDEEEEGQMTAKNTMDESSSSSSDSDSEGDSESSDSDEMTLEQRLQDQPITQNIRLGLFHGTVCSVMKNARERCKSVSVNEAIYAMNHDVSFISSDINMPMWNNLRVESLFSVVTCIFGLLCLIASLKPCCHNKRLPVYLGSVSFFASGALIFIPIVRILLVRSDLEQNIDSDYNVTIKLMTSWSLVASGVGAPFALMASFALIATKWFRATKHWYQHLTMNSDNHGLVQNGTAVEIKMTPLERN
ncbi:uncharacterized protein LOC132750941 isoform X1 [Ruditapes philippinarum]|uniref:uncharacterized protein LOC132750941 isoform X1 n=1 Tax=Ruditapes philippinarum TaxID=129788 RepID=UPI00295B8DCA|nr:uncharacterized protein LOC132750941 isoform X1 [Ruditapes philippinarum]